MSTSMVGWYHFSLRLHRVFTWATVDYFAKLTKCLPKVELTNLTTVLTVKVVEYL